MNACPCFLPRCSIYNLHIATPLTICNALPEVLTLAVTQGEGRSARKVYDGLLESGASMDLWNDSEQDLFLMAVPVIGGWEPLEPVCMSSGSRSRVKDKLVVTDRFDFAVLGPGQVAPLLLQCCFLH